MTENIRKFLIKTLFMREHSILLGNQRLIVTHNFWTLILMIHVQYGNISRKHHHLYSTIWTPVLRELLSCKSELDNTKDRYVVAVCRINGIVVGHIPKKISFLCAIFIKRGGTIQCIVSAIYHHIIPHLALALQNPKETLLFFKGFFITTIDFLVLLSWTQRNLFVYQHLMDHGNQVNSHIFSLIEVLKQIHKEQLF